MNTVLLAASLRLSRPGHHSREQALADAARQVGGIVEQSLLEPLEFFRVPVRIDCGILLAPPPRIKDLEVNPLQERAASRQCAIDARLWLSRGTMDRHSTPELPAKEQKLPWSAHPFVTAPTTSAEMTTNSDTAVSQVAADIVAVSHSVADGESDICHFLPSLHGSEACGCGRAF
ncbi:uncharacterized protein PG986_001067 [Apiospora aurea]|uniref:Uncharacterized protein n=1 Tax=Apiospora aurea TaxID=335848 RepID=A0ABR1QVS6_9PEZI